MPYNLNNGRGESLVETLVALLVAAFAMLTLSGMIANAARITKTARNWNADINKRAAFLEQRTASGDSVTSGGGAVTIKSGDETLIDNSVTFYVAEYGGEDVIAYVSSGA